MEDALQCFWFNFCQKNGAILNQIIKSTQYKKLGPNALRFPYQNLKSCTSHEKKMKQRTSDS